jgi:hypothetical protein
MVMSMLVVLVLGAVFATPQAQNPKPCAQAEHRQFDFWIGEWTVTGPGGKLAGSNRIERIEGGCGLQENWTGAGGGTGRSLNAWSPQDGKWHQTWLSNQGLWLELAGGLRDGAMVMEGRTIDRKKQTVLERVTWTPQPDGRVRQFWEQSRDGGKTWTVAFDGMYSREKPGRSNTARR